MKHILGMFCAVVMTIHCSTLAKGLVTGFEEDFLGGISKMSEAMSAGTKGKVEPCTILNDEDQTMYVQPLRIAYGQKGQWEEVKPGEKKTFNTPFATRTKAGIIPMFGSCPGGAGSELRASNISKFINALKARPKIFGR